YAFYLGVVSSRDFGSEDASIPSPENNKKRKIQVEQRELTDWFESAKIIPQKEASITRALELLSGQGLKTEYWKIITTTAGQIWRNNGGDKKSCNHLLAQICNYELRRSPYNQDFDNSLETPIRWYSIKNKYDYLKDLAIMIFSITPHIARCERIFSTFG
ncbi:1240_t:CDS:2, partial [Rhizophagus irregularis]